MRSKISVHRTVYVPAGQIVHMGDVTMGMQSPESSQSASLPDECKQLWLNHQLYPTALPSWKFVQHARFGFFLIIFIIDFVLFL